MAKRSRIPTLVETEPVGKIHYPREPIPVECDLDYGTFPGVPNVLGRLVAWCDNAMQVTVDAGTARERTVWLARHQVRRRRPRDANVNNR